MQFWTETWKKLDIYALGVLLLPSCRITLFESSKCTCKCKCTCSCLTTLKHKDVIILNQLFLKRNMEVTGLDSGFMQTSCYRLLCDEPLYHTQTLVFFSNLIQFILYPITVLKCIGAINLTFWCLEVTRPTCQLGILKIWDRYYLVVISNFDSSSLGQVPLTKIATYHHQLMDKNAITHPKGCYQVEVTHCSHYFYPLIYLS